MAKRVILLVFFCFSLLPQVASAFDHDGTNSGPLLEYLKKAKKKKKFIFNFDARSSFISSRAVRIGGIRIGLQYEEKFRVGIGLYFLTSPFERDFTLNPGTAQEVNVTGLLEFGYFGIYYERIWFHNKRWELSSPFVLGFGGAGYGYTNDAGEYTEIGEDGGVLINEFSFIAVYKFWKFFGIGAGLGFRIAYADELVRENLTAPIYIIKFKVFLGDVVKAIFKPKPKTLLDMPPIPTK